jgi:hypothetical protein
MKVKLNPLTEDEIFPVIRKVLHLDDSFIVLFTDYQEGIILKNDSFPNEVGNFQKKLLSKYEDYKGTVTLSNY